MMNYSVINKSKLFQNMSPDDTKQALAFFSAKQEHFAKNDIVKNRDARLTAFGLVLSGSITVYMDDFDGNCLVMSSAQASDTFGESLCFLQRNEPVYIVATQNTDILWLHCDRLQDDCGCEMSCELRNRFISLLANRALDMNNRIQVLSKFTIRDKLITYFSQCANRTKSDTFVLPMDRASLAAYIGTERSALSRELSKMQKDNIIHINKNTITLIRK
ncbi:MAG: Crp/Fnr family transcriptional regulator [Clostridia bacterium]|nr:Crp/Fnr family transcriptional regulator [Clostridia bacterium]